MRSEKRTRLNQKAQGQNKAKSFKKYSRTIILCVPSQACTLFIHIRQKYETKKIDGSAHDKKKRKTDDGAADKNSSRTHQGMREIDPFRSYQIAYYLRWSCPWIKTSPLLPPPPQNCQEGARSTRVISLTSNQAKRYMHSVRAKETRGIRVLSQSRKHGQEEREDRVIPRNRTQPKTNETAGFPRGIFLVHYCTCSNKRYSNKNGSKNQANNQQQQKTQNPDNNTRKQPRALETRSSLSCLKYVQPPRQRSLRPHSCHMPPPPPPPPYPDTYPDGHPSLTKHPSCDT